MYFSKRLLLLIAGISAAITSHAQSFPGYHTSHYAGIHGVPFNPASAAGSRYRWDVNIVGADARAGNTYIKFEKSSLMAGDSLRRWRDYFPDTNATRKQYGWGSADIMMPSGLYSIDEKQSVAFVWRVRGSASGGGVEAATANFFGIDYPNPKYNNRTVADSYGGGMGHWWNEFGLTYARVIRDRGDHRIKAGITLKYLAGQASVYAVGRDGAIFLKNQNTIDINRGTLHYAYNAELDTNSDSWQSLYSPFQNPGIGADIGVIYEWRPDNDGFGSIYEGGDWNPDADTWKARLGISVVDIGGIRYDKSLYSADLDMRAQNFPANMLGKRKEESIRQYANRIANTFTPLDTDSTYFMNLPTAVNLMGDYNIDGRFFVSASATIALTGGTKDDHKTSALTWMTVTPRYETRHLGAYLPVSVNRYGQVDAGVALRAGPLVIGSSSLFNTLFQSRINRADVFVALRVIPIRFSKWSWDKGGDGIFRRRKSNVGCPDI
ncbi:hypothetical protein EGT74_26320 [Chitinophaga lutea]|uniref:DUF5723 domain-containing protein n=1 Tax=Chitinophaga lutea TaxID=2488634 RepID=A0A3N4PCC2_9BACT|nr:DUF5723 family protein [Chitinophaga lutea]RPE05876.1 hypothetical protein EGT74_26320 [Chitinophaga lutea]